MSDNMTHLPLNDVATRLSFSISLSLIFHKYTCKPYAWHLQTIDHYLYIFSRARERELSCMIDIAIDIGSSIAIDIDIERQRINCKIAQMMN